MSLVCRCLIAFFFLWGLAASVTAQNSVDPIAQAQATGNLGPAKIKVGEHATLDLPQGMMYAPADVVQHAGGRVEVAANKSTLGVILPVFGGGWYISVAAIESGALTAQELGALPKDEIHTTLRAVALKTNPARMMAGFTKIDLGHFTEEPKVDATRNRFTTALRMFETGPTTVDEDFSAVDTYLFGRRHTLRFGLRTVVSEQGRLRPMYEKIIDTLQFQPGHRAADAKIGIDKPTQHLLDVVFGGRTDAEIEAEAAEETAAAARRAASRTGFDRTAQMKMLLAGLLGAVALVLLILAFRGGKPSQVDQSRMTRYSGRR